jgi:hypothetical protein
MKKEVRCIQMWCHVIESKNKMATTKLENRRKDGDKCEVVAYQHWCYWQPIEATCDETISTLPQFPNSTNLNPRLALDPMVKNVMNFLS